MRAILRQQRGSVLLIVAAAMVGLLSMSALAVDVGIVYLNKARMSKAADAAALAGAQELPKSTSTAESVATDYVKNKNGLTTDTVTAVASVTTSGTTTTSKVKVTISRDVELFFAKIIGRNTMSVTVSATAQVGTAGSVPWLVPFVFAKQTFEYDKVYRMQTYGTRKNVSGLTYTANGLDYANVKIGKQTTTDYYNYLTSGYQKNYSIDTTLGYYDPSSGGPTAVDAFAERLTNDTNTDYTQAKVGDARVMLVAVVDNITSTNGVLSRTVKDDTALNIVGFVGIFLKDVNKVNGKLQYYNNFWADVYVLKDLNVGTGDISTSSSADYGLRTIKLIE